MTHTDTYILWYLLKRWDTGVLINMCLQLATIDEAFITVKANEWIFLFMFTLVMSFQIKLITQFHRAFWVRTSGRLQIN
jgi:hypothetical protein